LLQAVPEAAVVIRLFRSQSRAGRISIGGTFPTMKWVATFYTQMATLQIEAEDGNEAMRKAVESPECTRALEQFKINHPDAPLFPFDFGNPVRGCRYWSSRPRNLLLGLPYGGGNYVLGGVLGLPVHR